MTHSARTEHSPDPASATGRLEEAFARHRNELLGTLFYLVGNREDAQDALQETFVKCWRNADQVAQVQNLKAWIFRIALNTGRDIRQTAWRRKKQSLPEGDTMIESKNSGPAAKLQHQERLDLVRQAVAQLRSEEQEVFLLRQNGEMTYDEISAAIGIPSGTVKTRMRLALNKLRVALAGL